MSFEALFILLSSPVPIKEDGGVELLSVFSCSTHSIVELSTGDTGKEGLEFFRLTGEVDDFTRFSGVIVFLIGVRGILRIEEKIHF